MPRVQTGNDIVAVGERLARDGDAEGGGAGGDEPGAGSGVGWEGGVGRMSAGGGGGGRHILGEFWRIMAHGCCWEPWE